MTTTLVNGIPAASVDLSDRGFQYGDGVFTTLSVQHGNPLFLDRHLNRLERDCLQVGIPPPDRASLKDDLHSLITGQQEAIIKIIITRGAGGRGYRFPEKMSPTRIVSLYPPAIYPPQYTSEGIDVCYCRLRLGINPVLAGLKHMNRLEQIMARSELSNAPDMIEGLLLDYEGNLVEGTMSNLFLVSGARILTPLLDRCGVSGVMRSIIMTGAAELNLSVQETRLTPEDITGASEVFLTNSIIGIWPVRSIERRYIGVGPVTLELCEWLKKITAKEATNG